MLGQRLLSESELLGSRTVLGIICRYLHGCRIGLQRTDLEGIPMDEKETE
jgi:sRNA-binding protein